MDEVNLELYGDYFIVTHQEHDLFTGTEPCFVEY
jgi:hypothetical protein